MSRSVIVTADDFGLALPVNEAVELAHRHGVLTTTSLLVGAPAAGDAVARAHRNPGLRVGLHVAICEAWPVCPPGAVPDLCDAQGELHGPITAAIRCLLDPGLPEQLEREIRAQFDAFSATGLRLDHVNAHNNMQLHPIVLPILLRVAREYGARAMRLPFEPLLSSWRAARRGLARRIAIWSVMRPWAAYVKRRIAGAGFAVNDHLFGIYDCGQLDTGLFTRLVRHLPEGVSEIHCHPATRRCPEIDRSMPRYRHEQELSALHSPALRDALHAPGLRVLAGFGELPS